MSHAVQPSVFGKCYVCEHAKVLHTPDCSVPDCQCKNFKIKGMFW